MEFGELAWSPRSPVSPVGSPIVLSGCPERPPPCTVTMSPFPGAPPSSAPSPSFVLPLLPHRAPVLSSLFCVYFLYSDKKRPEINLILKCPRVVSGSSQLACRGGRVGSPHPESGRKGCQAQLPPAEATRGQWCHTLAGCLLTLEVGAGGPEAEAGLGLQDCANTE